MFKSSRAQRMWLWLQHDRKSIMVMQYHSIITILVAVDILLRIFPLKIWYDIRSLDY